MKMEVKIDQDYHIERDLVRFRRLALLTLHFELCMRIVAIAKCMTVGQLFEYQDDSCLQFPYTLYVFLYPQKNSNSILKLRNTRYPLLPSLKNTSNA